LQFANGEIEMGSDMSRSAGSIQELKSGLHECQRLAKHPVAEGNRISGHLEFPSSRVSWALLIIEGKCV
jgi:hypothetical protein